LIANLKTTKECFAYDFVYSLTRSMYDFFSVSILILSPSLINKGTLILAPVSTVAGLVAFVAVLPLTPGSE